jgi:hypothetical protein
LRDEIFGQHWQDETWHETLQLICGMLSEEFVLKLIDYLIDREDKNNNSIHLLIASKCFVELKIQSIVQQTYLKLLNQIFAKRGTFSWSTGSTANGATIPIFRSNISQALLIVLEFWRNQAETLVWLEENVQTCIQSDTYESGDVAAVVVQKLAQIKAGDPETVGFLKTCIQFSTNYIVRATALCELIQQQEHHTDMLSVLEEYALSNEEHFVRWISILELSRIWQKNTRVFEILCKCANYDPFIRDQRARRQRFLNPRRVAISQLTSLHPNHPETLTILKNKAATDSDWQVRSLAISKLSEIGRDEVQKMEFLENCALKDSFERDISFDEDNPRQTALKAFLKYYSTHPRTLELLYERSVNDSDNQLREWAQEQLEVHNIKLVMEASSNG